MFQHGLIIYNYITFYFLYLSIIPIWDHPRHRSARGCGALRGSGATLDFNAFSTLTEHPTWSSRNGCETVVDLAWITMEHMWNKYGTYKHIWWTRVIDGICLLFSHNFQINPNQDVSKPNFFSIFWGAEDPSPAFQVWYTMAPWSGFCCACLRGSWPMWLVPWCRHGRPECCSPKKIDLRQIHLTYLL